MFYNNSISDKYFPQGQKALTRGAFIVGGRKYWETPVDSHRNTLYVRWHV